MSFSRFSSLTAISLLVVGIVLATWAAITPAYTDPAAHASGVEALRTRLYGDETTSTMAFDTASDTFHTLNARYGTAKWQIADLAYAAFAWAALIAAAGPMLGRRPFAGSRRFWPLFASTVAGLSIMFFGAALSLLQDMRRDLVPDWADTPAIPLFGLMASAVFVSPIVMVFILGPVATRRSPAGLLAVKGRGYLSSGIATLVYAIPILLSVLCIATFWTTGGWATSTGGAILGWLLLNARGIWIGDDIQPARDRA